MIKILSTPIFSTFNRNSKNLKALDNAAFKPNAVQAARTSTEAKEIITKESFSETIQKLHLKAFLEKLKGIKK